MSVTGDLAVNGPGANKLTVSGNNASRVLHISNAATATVAGLAIANGATFGGLGGGGILNEAGATLTLFHSALNNNTATAASNAVDVFGGGLLNQGKALVASSAFSGNQALGGGGTSFFGGSLGGAIDNFGGAALTVTDSAFVHKPSVGTGAGNFGIGGAIENNAGPSRTWRAPRRRPSPTPSPPTTWRGPARAGPCPHSPSEEVGTPVFKKL